MMWHTMSIPLGRHRTVSENFTDPGFPLPEGDRLSAIREEERRDRSGSVPPGGLWSIATSLPGRARASSQPNRPRSKSTRNNPPSPPQALPKEAEAAMKDEQQADKPEVTLRHRDFCPRRSRKLSDASENEDAVYESYYDVLQRANQWLSEHGDSQLVTMETITWCLPHPATGKVNKSTRRFRSPTSEFLKNGHPLLGDKDEEDGEELLSDTNTWSTEEREQLFTDSSVTHYSLSPEENNKYYRGIRLWYFSRGEQFWQSWAPKRQLHFRDYFPSRNGSVVSILRNINEDLVTNPVVGRVLRLDTLNVPLEESSTACVWDENPATDRRYYSVFRLVYLEYEGAQEFKAEIGFRDFCPRQDHRAPSAMGYEKYEEMFGRAARWLFHQKNFHVINLQTIPVKAKTSSKKEDLANVHLWESANHQEHGGKPTEYFLIMRVAYWRILGETGVSLPPRLSYRTATPAFIGRPSDTRHSRLFHAEDFEEAGHIIDAVSTWLNKSRGRLLSVETLPIRCRSKAQGMLGPEATFLQHEPSTGAIPEPVIFCIRVYMDGDFQNFPLERKWRHEADMVNGKSK